jgi:DNA-binding response OmpR family regulator
VPTGPIREARSRDLVALVVEDEFLIALDLGLLLERHGWHVLGPAATVEEALCLLDRETPDVAVLDVNLRGGMVTPVAARLRGLGVPFVLASACNGADLGDGVLVEASNLGKPVDEHRLLAALADIRGLDQGTGPLVLTKAAQTVP